MSDEYVDLPVSDEDEEELEDEMDDGDGESGGGSSKKKAKQHVEQLKRLQQKDPDFYKYLEEFDKDLLGFDDDDDEIEVSWSLFVSFLY